MYCKKKKNVRKKECKKKKEKIVKNIFQNNIALFLEQHGAMIAEVNFIAIFPYGNYI